MSERLAAADPGNAGWQRDLAVSYGRVAMVEARQGARDLALRGFRNGRGILARLKAQSPDDAHLPEDLAWFESQISSSAGTVGDALRYEGCLDRCGLIWANASV